jgi:hypothetical protein
MTIPDTTTVRLWPIPRMFQIFFIVIVLATLTVTAWALIAPVMEPAPAGIDCESGCIYGSTDIAQDHRPVAYDTRIDSDTLIGAVIAPLVIGITVALVTPGRSLLGRAWYGAVVASLAMITWLVIRMFYYAHSSMSEGVGADAPFLSEATLVSIAATIVCATIDTWWQRRRYVWVRAWSLLFFEAILLALFGYSITESTQSSATLIVEMFLGTIAVILIITFLIFRRRSIHVAAKFAGLRLLISLLGGYLGGMAEQSQYSYEYVWVAASVGAVLTYGLGMWMIGTRPAPLKD